MTAKKRLTVASRSLTGRLPGLPDRASSSETGLDMLAITRERNISIFGPALEILMNCANKWSAGCADLEYVTIAKAEIEKPRATCIHNTTGAPECCDFLGMYS